ncbi:hypothetical protein EV127DRAFT_513229 [Xylaria flabelliformis]|nr:hypothetical protein EV127DRAFT_513229 [Xylaria flabelliformis]
MVAAIPTPVQLPTSYREQLALTFDRQLEADKVDRLPSISECVVHLELLDAIVHVEGQVTAWGKEKGLAEGVAWNTYCSAAAQRFLKWSLTGSHGMPTPPLDILIVWHAYMLNTAAYRQYEIEVLKGRMKPDGISWATMHRWIDEDSRFNICAEDAATMGQPPFPIDLLGALKDGKVQIDSTSPSPSIDFDMVAAVQWQLKFAHKMHNTKWLRSLFASQILESAIRRYEMFITLIAEHPCSSLSPTPDIDLVWHTHQLSPKRYGLYSAMKTNGKFINHNDNLAKDTLGRAFKSTKTLFRDRFGSEYRVCYCESCLVSSRSPDGHFRNEQSSECSGESCAGESCSGEDCHGVYCGNGNCSSPNCCYFDNTA